MKKKIKFIIETKFYDTRKIQSFDNYAEWKKEVEEISCTRWIRGTGEEFTIAIYQVESGDIENSRELVYHPASQDRWADIDRIPEDWGEPVWHSQVKYTLFYEEDGKYIDDIEEEYDTEEEMIADNSPFNYIEIPQEFIYIVKYIKELVKWKK